MNLLSDCYASFVNLDHRADRLLKMKSELKRVGIDATRTRGFRANEYQGPTERVKKMLEPGQTPGAIGCHLSQQKVMRDALAQGKHAFVMEDDLHFCDDFMTRMELMSSFCSATDWSVLWLGGTFHIDRAAWHPQLGRDAELTDDPHLVRTFGAWCTYAYIVNRDSIERVNQLLDAFLPETIGIDYSMIKVVQPVMKTFAFVPGAVRQNDDRSDISPGIRYFSKFAELGPYWYADKLSDFDPKTFNWQLAKNGGPK